MVNYKFQTMGALFWSAASQLVSLWTSFEFRVVVVVVEVLQSEVALAGVWRFVSEGATGGGGRVTYTVFFLFDFVDSCCIWH